MQISSSNYEVQSYMKGIQVMRQYWAHNSTNIYRCRFWKQSYWHSL